jgi:hypothetical protein
VGADSGSAAENCEQATSSLFCYECKAFLCEKCSADIHTQRIARGHSIVAASIKKQVARTCAAHEGERLSMFCTQCSAVVCTHCMLVGAHVGHGCFSLKVPVRVETGLLVADVSVSLSLCRT